MKEKMLRAAREKVQVTHKGKPIRLTADLSAETLQARREWGPTFNILKEKNFQPRISYLAKLSFISEGKMKFFTDKQVLRDFITTRSALQELLKEALHIDGNNQYQPFQKQTKRSRSPSKETCACRLLYVVRRGFLCKQVCLSRAARSYSWDYRHPPPRLLISVFLVEVGFHHVGLADLELLTSGDPPTSTSQSTGITGCWDDRCEPLYLAKTEFKSWGSYTHQITRPTTWVNYPAATQGFFFDELRGQCGLSWNLDSLAYAEGLFSLGLGDQWSLSWSLEGLTSAEVPKALKLENDHEGIFDILPLGSKREDRESPGREATRVASATLLAGAARLPAPGATLPSAEYTGQTGSAGPIPTRKTAIGSAED
ncbi:LINE-1 retrotransposable element ORF1 protein [Plecturocebus cupreus]